MNTRWGLQSFFQTAHGDWTAAQGQYQQAHHFFFLVNSSYLTSPVFLLLHSISSLIDGCYWSTESALGVPLWWKRPWSKVKWGQRWWRSEVVTGSNQFRVEGLSGAGTDAQALLSLSYCIRHSSSNNEHLLQLWASKQEINIARDLPKKRVFHIALMLVLVCFAKAFSI